MSKHTPGPWLLEPSDPWRDRAGNRTQWGEFLISVGSRDHRDEAYYRIASVSNVNDLKQNEANARLIAAAPDLLEALQAMVDCYHTMDVRCCAWASQLAAAAIAKATQP